MQNINVKPQTRRNIHMRNSGSRSPAPFEDRDSQDSAVEESDTGEEDDGRYRPATVPRREEFNISRSVPRTPERPRLQSQTLINSNFRRTVQPPKTPYAREPIYKPESAIPPVGNNGVMTALAVLFLVATLSAYYIFMPAAPPRLEERHCAYTELRQRFPRYEKTVWRVLSVGIENILNMRTHAPGVYLFVHLGHKVTNDLIRVIAVHSAACFGGAMRPVEMANDAFTSERAVNDYGYAVQQFKSKLQEGHVILIANLNEIPAESARALHTICDTYSPIAEDVIIFLTLVINEASEHPVKDARDMLYELWSEKLKSHELEPLITRVTDQVIAFHD